MANLIALYPEYEYLLAQIQLVLFMLGMGATLTVSDFAPVFTQPKALVYGLTFELLVTPLLAILVCHLAGLGPGLAIGLLLVAALPGGTLSNAFTYLSKSNVALSIALSATATLLAILTIPLVLRFLAGYTVQGKDYELVAQLEMPVWGIIREIFICMLIPLGIGMLVPRYCAEETQNRVSRICLLIGFALVGVMVVGAIGADRIELSEHGWRGPLAIIGFCILTQQTSILFIRWSSWPSRDWVAIGIEATIRNIYLGILLAALLCPADSEGSAAVLGRQILFVVLFYGPAALIGALPLALRMRRRHRREEATP